MRVTQKGGVAAVPLLSSVFVFAAFQGFALVSNPILPVPGMILLFLFVLFFIKN